MTPHLYANPNRNAPVRANNLRFWGYPSRSSKVRVIVIHTAEIAPAYSGADDRAERIANYFTHSDRAASYHEVGDSDSYVTCLPPEATAFGARGANADGWHWSFATQAHRWPDKPARWRDAALEIAAERCRLAARRFNIPVRRITRSEWRSGAAGFISHADVDPTRRTDPGAGFPWGRFLELVRQEEDVALSEEDVQRIAREVWRYQISDTRSDGQITTATALRRGLRYSQSAVEALQK